MTLLSPALQTDFDANQVRRLIAEYLGIDPARLTDEACFSEDLGLDSLDRLELMILIEDEFPGVEISEGDANQIEVVSDLIQHVELLDKAKSAAANNQVVANHQNVGGSIS